jgi:RNA polymerase sigma-70 factor (ECF subfamily)
LQFKQSYATILKGVELLPPARKNIFKMSRVEGLTYDEIAAQMNGVKDHIVKALLFLGNYPRLHSDELPLIVPLLVSLSFRNY